MPESRGKWTDLIAGVGLEIHGMFDQGDDQYTPGIFNILNKSTGEGAQRNYTGKTGFTELHEFEDGDNIPAVHRYKTYTTTVNYKNYGGHVMITKNMVEDRNFDAQLGEMKDLSRTANYSQDKSGMQLFNGAFATTSKVNGYTIQFYGDGVPTLSTVHPTVVPGASTQSNASSTSIALGHDNFETGRLALELQQADNGTALSMTGKVMLVCPLALEKTAKETLNSELTPENANNAINVFRGSYDIATSKFLDASNGGSNTAWFLTNQGVHMLQAETRQEKELEMDVNILNKVATYTVDARWANHVRDWRGVWGSQGDLSTYSS